MCAGVITDVRDNKKIVQFMKPHGTKKNVFVHPDVPDVQTVTDEMIVGRNLLLMPCGNSCREWRIEGFKFD